MSSPWSSPVWSFFTVAEDDNAVTICKAYSARIARGGKKSSSFNTTNLIAHLKSRHRGEEVFKEHEAVAAAASTSSDKTNAVKTKATTARKSDVTILQSFEKSRLFARDSEKTKAINDKVMDFIALGDQPFSVVEDPSFRSLLAHLEPRYTLPSRRYFSDVSLPALYDVVATHIHNLINKNGLHKFYNRHMDVRC